MQHFVHGLAVIEKASISQRFKGFFRLFHSITESPIGRGKCPKKLKISSKKRPQ